MTDRVDEAAVLVATLLVLHFLLRPALLSWPLAPDLLTGAVLLAGLRARAGIAAAVGFGAGVLDGAMALAGIGLGGLVYAVLGYATSRWRELFFSDVPLFVFLYLFVGCWITQLILNGLTDFALAPGFVLVQAPVASALTAAICGAADRGLAGRARA